MVSRCSKVLLLQSVLFRVSRPEDIKELAQGTDSSPEFNRKLFSRVECLIQDGYHFMKTTHKSSHSFKPITNFEEFYDQITNPSHRDELSTLCVPVFVVSQMDRDEFGVPGLCLSRKGGTWRSIVT